MRKPSTMADVARRAGVSTATVSNVLGRKRVVAADLADRVHQAAAELDYQIDRAASLLRSGRSSVVAIVVPSLDNPFFTGLIASVERAIKGEGYDIIVCSSNDEDATERQRIAAMLSWKPAGLIVVPCSDGFPARDLVDFSQVPAVVVDRVAGIEGMSSVAIDNAQAARLAADHLIALGHTDILISASSLSLANIRERCGGITAAMAEARLPPPAILEVGHSFESVAGALERHLASHGQPTAIIALTNTATIGVLGAARDLGIRIPEDLSLVGFDDYAWMSSSTPSISAVRQPIDLLGAAAWEQLRIQLADGDASPSALVFTCKLELRQSSRAATSARMVRSIQ